MKRFIEDWLDTWAPNCGASRSVFAGQFNALLTRIFNEICLRAELKMTITNTLEGAHYAAMREVFQEIEDLCKQRKR